MAEFVGITRARELPGLRMILLRGLPSPWTQAAKGILRIKKLDYTSVAPTPDDPPDALHSWTGQTSYPAAMYADEPPRSGWAEILLLAERLEPSPPLVPADPALRARMFGLAHEICGEMGLGWCQRLRMVERRFAANPDDPIARMLAGKYGYRPDSAAQARRRVLDVLGLLAAELTASREAGGRFLLGDAISAVDVYWATFCNLVSPLPADQLPLPEPVRAMFTEPEAEVLAAVDDALLAHRDLVYAEYLGLPVEL